MSALTTFTNCIVEGGNGHSLGHYRQMYYVIKPHRLACRNKASSSFLASIDLRFLRLGGDPACRLDYIWVSGTPDKARLAMQQAQHGCSYSDHLGVEVVCTFQDDCVDRCLSACQLATCPA